VQNYSPEDVPVYENVRQALIAGKITSRDVWGMMNRGEFTPGTENLLHDIIDFGHYRWEAQQAAKRAEEAIASDSSLRASEYLAQYMAQNR